MAEDIFRLIQRSALYYKRLMTKFLERFDITFAQYQVLSIVKWHQPLTAKEILAYLDTDKATLSGILSRLEKRDLVIRSEDKKDRRLMYVQLSKTALALIEAIEGKTATLNEDLLKNVKNRERKNFVSTFEKIIETQNERLSALKKNTTEETNK